MASEAYRFMTGSQQNHAQSAKWTTETRPVILWVENLSLWTLPVVGYAWFRYSRFGIRFMTSTPGGRAMVWLLRVVGIVASPPQRVVLTSHGERVDDPTSQDFVIQARINDFTARLFAMQQALFASIRYPDQRVRKVQVATNLRSTVGREIYDLLLLTELARYHHRNDQLPEPHLIIVSRFAVLANLLPAGWAGDSVEFVYQEDRYQSLTLRLGRGILGALVDAVRPPRRRSSNRPSIAIASVFGLAPSSGLSDLYWWRNSGIPGEQVILCFDRADCPASRAYVAEARRLGMRCVVLDRRAVGDSPELLWKAAPGFATALKRLWWQLRVFMWSFSQGRLGRWVACRMLDMLHWSGRMEDFLTEFNARGLFHHNDGGLDYLSLACEAAGAARIGHQWSNYHWPAAYMARLHQVVFCWGPHFARVLEAVGSCPDHVLVSGCIVRGTSCHDNKREGGFGYREEMMRGGASRVLALFDTSLPCEGFYEFFLQRAIEDSRWALLIKPKGDASIPWKRWHLPPLQALYENAVATGRVKMLDWRLSPIAAAREADLSVGVDINSASIIAALGGYRSIHLDYVRFHASPFSEWAYFYKAGPDRLVFDDPWKLWKSLNRYFDEPGALPDLGVADEQLLRHIDQFRDGRAGERIGQYLRWYLEGLSGGLVRDQALEQADCRYADTWGSEAVILGPSGVHSPMGCSAKQARPATTLYGYS